MTLSDLEFLRLLPLFMREDAANIALSKGVDAVIRPLAARLKLLSTWDKIEELSEAELDELAWELNIRWYHLAEDIETKRRFVRDSDLIHAKMGTPWAVERLLSSYFTDAKVEEWFEYGGEPYFFRISSGDPAIFGDKHQEFMELLEHTKRKSAWLGGLRFAHKAPPAPLYTGVNHGMGARIVIKPYAENGYAASAELHAGAWAKAGVRLAVRGKGE